MAKKTPPKLSASALMGKLVGATVALPTAGLVYAVAAWQGVPLTTATGRAVGAGMLMFVGLSILTRILVASFGKDLRAIRSPSPLNSNLSTDDSTDRGAEAA